MSQTIVHEVLAKKPKRRVEWVLVECHLFTLWEYPNGAPTYVRLNIESWRRHSHGRCGEPIFLNEKNLREYIPDLPEEGGL
eukprot:s1529_g4.t1